MKKTMKATHYSIIISCVILSTVLGQSLEDRISSYNLIAGTQTIGAVYQFTQKSKTVETAEAILEMGSNIIKVKVSGSEEGQHDLRTILDMPFKYYFFWYRSSASWYKQFPETREKAEYEAVYAFVEHLLTEYNGSGKQFFVGHWEGDWYLLPGYNAKGDADLSATENMVKWLNIRQKALDDAKRSVEHENVDVFHYTEVNRVRDALVQGKRRLVNAVLPHVNVDYVSYSVYDVQRLEQKHFNETFNYIESKLKPKPGIKGKRVFVGEYGVCAESVKGNELLHESMNRSYLIKALNWGCPFILYWEMYNNEVKNGNQRGFWLIDDKNNKWPLYDTHHNLYAAAKEAIRDFHNRETRMPTAVEYQAWAVTWLSNWNSETKSCPQIALDSL